MTFELIEKKFLKNINTTGYVYEHNKTKARLVFLQNDDVNKSFSISFKTIPYNDNGIFHILEHSVLCGSEKYPLKEPFVELLKGSFNTFLNAMTFPDKTMYPVSSKNDEDLKILMDIYLDAVFNPKLVSNKNILAQEGWHYHLENKNDDLIYKGVVYNEMKGVYSSVDEVLDQVTVENLFSETAYKYSYGGKPAAIPSITHEEFVNTYKENYHPSNSYIVLYGDINVENYLQHIDSYLNNYDYKDYSNYVVTEQKTYSNNIVKSTYFNEDIKNKAYVSYNYVLGDITELSQVESVDIIDDILLGNSNTIFRKYFIDNNICEDVYGYLQKDRKELVYTIIFKYVNDDKLTTLDSDYKNILNKVLEDGFDYEQIQASINKKNFSIKEEVNKTSSPKGVSYAIRMLRTWIHNGSPLNNFDFDSMIENLQQNHTNRSYEKLARKFLLDNNKQAIIHLIPTNVQKNEEIDLISYQNSLSKEEITKIIKETNELGQWQNSSDSKEDLSKIKSVDAKSVNLKNPFKETVFEEVNGISYSHFNTITNGISYSRLLFDISDFTVEQLQYTSVLSYLLFNLNTKNKSELEVVKDIDFNLGSINSNIEIFRQFNGDELNIKFVVAAKNLVEKTSKLISILDETTLNADFSNKQAIYNILLELKLMLENKFKQSGHAFVSKRVTSYYCTQAKLADLINEYDFYLFIDNLLTNYEDKFSSISEQLTNICHIIFNSTRLLTNFVGSDEEYTNYKKDINNYISKLDNKENKQAGYSVTLAPKNYSEGFYFDSLVQYVGVGYNLGKYFEKEMVLRHIIGLDYLWNNVRVRGGAYGSGMTLNNFANFSMWSFRDPNLTKTLDTYYGTSNYIKNLNIDDETLNKYLIGTLNGMDTLYSPNGRAYYSLSSHITNHPKDRYDKVIESIKTTTVEDLTSFAPYFDNMEEKAYKCIIGTKEIIKENEHLFNDVIELK